MTKRWSKLFVAALLSLCLLFATAFVGVATFTTARAAGEDAQITLGDESDFVIESGVLKGLSDAGLEKIAGDGVLYAINVPESVYQIDDDAFKDDAQLYSVYIPDAEKEWSDYDKEWYYSGYFNLGASAFSGCTSLVSVHLPDGLGSWGEGAFEGCTALQSVNVPGTVYGVPNNSFKGCTSLVTVTFDNNVFGMSYVNQIGASAFANSGLTEVEIPYGVNSIGANAYAGTNLTSLFIPGSVYSIGENAFGDVAFENIQFECSIGLILGAFGNVAFDNFDFENGSYYNSWNAADKEPLEFADNATVFLPHAEDISPILFVETIIKFSNASILVSPDDNSYNAVTSALKEFLEELSGLANDDVLSGYSGAGDALSYLNGMTKGEVSEYIAAIREKHFFPVTLTFSVTDTLGDTYELTQDKLATSDYPLPGASPEYVLKKDADGNRIGWEYDENYDFPTEIDGVAVNPNNWIKVDYYTDFYFNKGNLKLTGDVTLTQTVAAAIDDPTDEVITYSGQPYTLSEQNARGVDITRITLDGTAVNSAVDAGTYTVYVALKDGCVWSDGEGSEEEKSFELVIEKKAATLKWYYGEEDVTQELNFEIAYSEDGAAVANFKAEIVGEGEELTAASGLEITKQGVVYTASVLTDGTYVFAPIHKNFDFGSNAYIVRVMPFDVDLSKTLTWSVTTSKGETLTLGDGTVYIGSQGGNVVIHTLPHPGISYTDIRNVEKSIVRYTNNATTLSLAANDAYTVSNMSGHLQTDSGIYTASLTITAKDNYKLTTALVNNGYEAQGMTVTIDADGKTAVVTKVWYLIELENELLDNDKSIAAEAWVEYSIPGWTFGDTDVTVKAPRLVHGDEDENWLTNTNVTFELFLGDALIASGFYRNRFAYYINSSMPAGNYRLEATVRVVTIGGNHKHWWNKEDHTSTDTGLVAHNFTRTYEFTVAAANIGISVEPGVNGYGDYEWELSVGADKERLFDKFVGEVYNSVTTTSVTRDGYWATTAANDYYGEHVISYNLASMNNEVYLEENDNKLLNRISSEVPDTYTIYFQISAPNHNNLTDVGAEGRYAYYFIVTVYKPIAAPIVVDDGLFYTGAKVLPEIEDNELYETVWSDTDTYIEGGKHSVSFRLYDTTHYRWDGVSGATVTVEFNIAKADNAWVRVPNIVDWSYETFDTQVNRIYAVTKFLDAGQNVVFSVTTPDGSVIEGLGSFAVNLDGTINNAELVASLNSLKVGAYKLNVTVAGTNNYNPLNQSVDFAISKSMNAWADGDDDLSLPNWVVGKYNEEENPIVVNAAHGNVNIIVTDIDGKEYYNSVTGVNKLNECEVGKYLLKAWVAETENFTALPERTFTIEVLEKVGLPWWATMLIVIGALAVAALIIFILWKKGVFQILTEKLVVAIRTKATVDATIASVRAAKMMEEGKKSVADAKRRERIEELRRRAQEHRDLPPEEKAAKLEAKAQAEAEKAEKSRVRSESMMARAERMRSRSNSESGEQETAEAETPETETPVAETEAPVTETPVAETETPVTETAATETPVEATADEGETPAEE